MIRFASAPPPAPGDPLRWSDGDPGRCYAELLAVIGRARHLGESRAVNGTVLVGRAPHVAPEAWLHHLYPPLSAGELVELETRLGRPVPAPYRWWLALHNGLGLFVSALSLYGLVLRIDRTGATRLPFNLATMNVHERPPDATSDAFFIGGYSHDPGYWLYLGGDDRVHLCLRGSASPLYSWTSLPIMVASEARRLAGLYDDQGRLIGVQDR